MNKLVFKHNVGYWIMIVLITLLLFWNLSTLYAGDNWSILRITLQSTFLFLVYKRHKWVRSILLFCSAFYATLMSIQFLSKTVLKLIGDRDDIDVYVLVEKLVIILVCTMVYFYAKESLSLTGGTDENQKDKVVKHRV